MDKKNKAAAKKPAEAKKYNAVSELDKQVKADHKMQAFEKLDSLNLSTPEDFDADEELRLALEKKYTSGD